MEFGIVFILLGLAALFDDSDSGGQTTADANEGPDGQVENGSSVDDTIFAGDGPDTVIAGNGDDFVASGAGADRIFGGEGDDIIAPQGGNDNVFGGPGNDFVVALTIDENDDTLTIGSGDDFLRGGGGKDTIADFIGDDTLYGDAQDDLLIALDIEGGAGSDFLFGGSNADTLIGDSGDVMVGGSGGDTFVSALYAGTPGAIFVEDFNPAEEDQLVIQTEDANASTITQNIVAAGSDDAGLKIEVLLDGQAVAVVNGPDFIPTTDITLLQVDPNTGDAETLSPVFEYGQATGDDIIGTPNADRIEAGDGDNVVDAQAGNDTVFGGDGDDSISGGEGNDRVFLGKGNDVIQLNDSGDDFIRGGGGSDQITDRNGANTVYGDAGADTIVTAYGDDDGPDLVYGGFGDDSFLAFDGDTLFGGQGADEFETQETDNDADPIYIMDFNPNEGDRLDIEVLHSDAVVEQSVRDGGVMIVIDGSDAVFVAGVSSLPSSAFRIEF